MGSFSAEGWELDFQRRQQLFDDDIDIAAKFLEELDGINIHPDQQDKWIWREDASAAYTVGSTYKMLMKDHNDENQDGAFNALWKVKVPSKVSFFVWRLIKDRLPTRVNLRRRNVEINDPTCPFCTNQEEDATHVFLAATKFYLSSGNHYHGQIFQVHYHKTRDSTSSSTC